MDTQEIQEALNKITPGPWKYWMERDTFLGNVGNIYSPDGVGKRFVAGNSGVRGTVNTEFIAKAPEYITYLLQLEEGQGYVIDHYKQENASLLQVVEEQKKALEWANRIIGSGLDMSSPLRYDPVSWNIEYHEKWK